MVTAACRQHNAALKRLRRVAEATGQAVACEETMQIGKIWKPPKGGHARHNMDYDFWDGEEVSWSWLDMIAQVDQQRGRAWSTGLMAAVAASFGARWPFATTATTTVEA